MIAYEDRCCSALDLAVRRAVRARGSLAVAREFVPVNGVSNFPGFVRSRWPTYRDTGFPVQGKPRPSMLLCIADADVAAGQLGLPVRDGLPDEWITEAEQAFVELLRSQTDRPELVYGVLLRWSQESLLIAGFDRPGVLQRLSGRRPLDQVALDRFLERCGPDPRTVANEMFTTCFDSPQRCLDEMAKAMRWAKLKKGDTRKDDALDLLSRDDIELLLERVPDLGRCASAVWEMAQGSD